MSCLLADVGLAIGSGSFDTLAGKYCANDCVGGLPYGDEAGVENGDELWFNDCSESLSIGTE